MTACCHQRKTLSLFFLLLLLLQEVPAEEQIELPLEDDDCVHSLPKSLSTFLAAAAAAGGAP
jgi:hypothetical protein